MNERRTCASERTKLTQPCSAPVHLPPFGKQARALRESAQEDQTVYLVYGCDRIKIGTARNKQRRYWELQATCPIDLKVVRTIPGGKILEARLHKRFGEQRLHGEWFWLSPELRAFISETASGAEQLREAEEDYRQFLYEELKHQERVNADSCD